MVSIPIIGLLVYSVGTLLERATDVNSKFYNYISIIVSALGGVFAVIVYKFTPSFLPASNVFDAFLMGIMSGIAADGSHEIIEKFKINKSNDLDFDDIDFTKIIDAVQESIAEVIKEVSNLKNEVNDEKTLINKIIGKVLDSDKDSNEAVIKEQNR